ncbi:MAG: hypothetical protein AAF533_15855 [Acidobacteriota bacterium]
MSKPDDFTEETWPRLREAMETGGPTSVAELIAGFEDAKQRRQLAFFAHRAFSGRDWRGKTLDALAEVTRLGMDEMLAQASSAESEDDRVRFIDLANVMSYNLSADLADCWPGDEIPRTREHFEQGLASAERCLEWRRELGKGPGPFSMAWWAKGIHELSLGRADDALASFEESQRHAVEGAEAEGQATTIDANGHWSVLLAEGYVALAAARQGAEGADARLDRCLEAIGAAIQAQPDEAGNLGFCRDQLEVVRGQA